MISIAQGSATPPLRFSAHIELDDGTPHEAAFDRFNDAKDWLAKEVATNPTSECYHIYDEYLLQYHFSETLNF